jgi:hypothetical protein
MAAFSKYNIFVQDLLIGTHDFDAHTLKILLSNTAPNAATHVVRSDAVEISTGNGYTQGAAGLAVALSGGAPNQTGAAGTSRLVPSADITVTATGTVGPFRYVPLYNDTPTTPLDPLICNWDYGAAITLAVGETFTTDFDNTNTGGIFGMA